MKQYTIKMMPLMLLMLGLAACAEADQADAAKSTNVQDIASNHLSSIVLGSGCFWGAEKYYENLDGVVNAVSGYADGRGMEANYKTITLVEVSFNADVISAETLIKHFFELHDPTQKNRQGNDVGTQYRSIVLTTNESQLATAQTLRDVYQQQLTASGYGEIRTIIKPLEQFYPAETYHQDYLAKNPNGYCPNHATGVKFIDSPTTREIVEVDNSGLLNGKVIMILEAEIYCPYCQKFRADVSEAYQGDIPLVYRNAMQLQGLDIKTPTWATPTIFFLEDGQEKFAKQGYMSGQEFYKALGFFKLGDSEAYKTAFDEGTDNRFCKQYDLFKNTPPGVFTDKLSGAPLFDTDNRFDSGTGWLSFTEPVAGAVIEQADNSFGMQRTAILAKTSGIHLGHVFDDGPNGQPRYCINATVLDFVPRGVMP